MTRASDLEALAERVEEVRIRIWTPWGDYDVTGPAVPVTAGSNRSEYLKPRSSKGTDAMTALQRAAAHLADEMEGLLPYLEAHHFNIGELAGAVSAVRDAITEEQTND